MLPWFKSKHDKSASSNPVRTNMTEVPVDINLGIDFGSRYTKVCYRDIAQEMSKVVTFSEGKPSIDDTLIPSSILVRSDDFLYHPLTMKESKERYSSSDKCIDGIKVRLARIHSRDAYKSWGLSPVPLIQTPEDIQAICAYYLAGVINKSKKWIASMESESFRGRIVRWSANVGVPVEYYDSNAVGIFRDVLRVAWSMADLVDDETLSWADCKYFYIEGMKSTAEACDCHAMPEIMSAVMSFMTSGAVDEGNYAFYDVGAYTLDGVTFKFLRQDGEPRVNIYSGKVEPLGVRSLACKVSSKIHGFDGENDHALIIRNEDFFNNEKKEIHGLVAKVILDGRDKDPYGYKMSRENKHLRIFLSGGGSQSDFYQPQILSTYDIRSQKNVGVPPYQLEKLPLPRDFSLNGLSKEYFYRYHIAYGLSVPEGEYPRYGLPSQFSSIVREKIRGIPSESSVKNKCCKEGCTKRAILNGLYCIDHGGSYD